MCQIWYGSVQLFGIFPTFFECVTHQTPSKYPFGAREFFLADVHSQMNLHTCLKFGPDRSRGLESFPELSIDDSLTPCPSGIEVLIFSSCPFPDEMHTCAKFVPDRYSCLASFPHFTICDCLAYINSLVNPGVRVPNLVPIGPVVWKLSHIFELMNP